MSNEDTPQKPALKIFNPSEIKPRSREQYREDIQRRSQQDLGHAASILDEIRSAQTVAACLAKSDHDGVNGYERLRQFAASDILKEDGDVLTPDSKTLLNTLIIDMLSDGRINLNMNSSELFNTICHEITAISRDGLRSRELMATMRSSNFPSQ